jgi:hypothetical protein
MNPKPSLLRRILDHIRGKDESDLVLKHGGAGVPAADSPPFRTTPLRANSTPVVPAAVGRRLAAAVCRRLAASPRLYVAASPPLFSDRD